MMTIKGCTKFFYVITSKIGVVLLKSYLFIDWLFWVLRRIGNIPAMKRRVVYWWCCENALLHHMSSNRKDGSLLMVMVLCKTSWFYKGLLLLKKSRRRGNGKDKRGRVKVIYNWLPVSIYSTLIPVLLSYFIEAFLLPLLIFIHSMMGLLGLQKKKTSNEKSESLILRWPVGHLFLILLY